MTKKIVVTGIGASSPLGGTAPESWAALLAAPTLLTSWYGMNFRNMPELETGYHYFIIGTVVIVGGLFVVLRRAKWL